MCGNVARSAYCRFNKCCAMIVATVWWATVVCLGAEARNARLAGGVPASEGDFPYLAASLHPEIRCTASIVGTEWLLGAAHCYVVDAMKVKPEDVLIVAGVVNFLDTFSPGRQTRLARSIYIHPKYEEEVLSSNDLALVKIHPFSVTNFVSPIPISGEPFVMEKEVKCMATGWGDHKEDSNNTLLRKLPVIAAQSESICHGLKPSQRFKMICLKKNHGKGLCDGDSGGPLVCGGKVVGVAHQVYTERSRWDQVPNMSCGAKDIVHTYMFTCPYLDWIGKYLPEAPRKPASCFVSEGGKPLKTSLQPFCENTIFGFPVDGAPRRVPSI